MHKFEEFYKNKRILITGADGFIGSHLTEALISYEALVSVLVHDEKLKNLNKIEDKMESVLIGDITDRNIIKLISDNKSEIIFHLAVDGYVRNSIENPLRVNGINLNGTLNVLEAARVLNDKNQFERLVFSSTCLVYGNKNKPVNEGDELKPNNPYAASKAAAELYCYSYYKTYNIPVAIMRLFNTYGPRQIKDVVALFIEKALKNDDIKLEGGGLQTRDFNYISDIIEALLIIGSDGKAIGEIVNFGSGDDVSIKELAELIVKLIDSKSNIIIAEQRTGQDMKQSCDNSKARRLFNWQPKVSLEEGLKMTIDYYRKAFQ